MKLHLLALVLVLVSGAVENPKQRYSFEDDKFVVYSEMISAEEYSFKVMLEGLAWISIGWGMNGGMLGADCMVYLPGDENPITNRHTKAKGMSGVPVDDIQLDYSNAVHFQNGTHTYFEFTRPIEMATHEHNIALNEATTLIYAYGRGSSWGGHSHSGSPRVGRGSIAWDNSTGYPDEQVVADSDNWATYHGALMFAAWGVLLPFGVYASVFLRELNSWLVVHRTANVLGVLATAAGFILAVVKTDDHFAFAHAKYGLAIMLLSAVMPLSGLLRPHAPSADEIKSKVRLVWEVSHKGAGYALLVLAAMNLKSGLEMLDNTAFTHAAEATAAVFLGLVVLGVVLKAQDTWRTNKAEYTQL